MSELYCANLMCSFHNRRLNSTQGEIRVGPSHQVKEISAPSFKGFICLFMCPWRAAASVMGPQFPDQGLEPRPQQ